jgi:hypothetical protein
MSAKPSVGSSDIDVEKLATTIVVRGGPIVWFLRLHTCKDGQPPASRAARAAASVRAAK